MSPTTFVMLCRYRAVLRAPLPLDDELIYRCVLLNWRRTTLSL